MRTRSIEVIGTVVVALCLLLSSAVAAGARGLAVPSPVAAWKPGDKVWTTTPPEQVASTRSSLSNGCERVPASGFIGSGVYAATATDPGSFWDWTASSSGQPFHWYVFGAGGTILANAHSSGIGGSTSVSAGNRYWKVQNLGSLPQAWNVCWS